MGFITSRHGHEMKEIVKRTRVRSVHANTGYE